MNLIHKPYAILVIPVCNSILELSHLIAENIKSLAKYLGIFALTFLIVSILGYYNLAIRSLRWILLGVASSIGFGFGMHTFVLFLAPHIAAVTMAAHTCNSLNFKEPPYPDAIICPDVIDSSNEITFMNILQKVWLESFMWGLGTAIGELPPYLAARLRAQAMGRRSGGPNTAGDRGVDDTAGWEAWMIKIITKVGFFGILLCAAIPNPLFDAAGVASGMAQIPFISFFGATLIGKAIIKVLLQSSFVILSFHKNNLELVIRQVDKRLVELLPATKDLSFSSSLVELLEKQRENVLTKKIGETKQSSMVQILFHWVIYLCFILFFISLINALDNQYRERKATKKNKRD